MYSVNLNNRNMIKIRIILLFVCTSYLFSCNKAVRIPESQIGNDEHVISIVPSIENMMPVDLTPYLDTVKYVKLELMGESTIGSIDKVIVYEERIYILDKQTNSLFVFDMKGNYLHKIARVGQGPGEYIQLDFFDIDRENRHIVLTDLLTYWVIRYDFDGNFLFRQKIPVWCEGVSILPNKGIALYANFRNNSGVLNPEYNLLSLDSNMNIKKAYFPYHSGDFHVKITTSVEGHFYHFKDHLNFSFPGGSTVYQFKNDSLISKYKINFGKDILPIENTGNTRQLIEYYENNKYSGIRGNVMENDELLFFSIRIVDIPLVPTIYYSKESGNTLLSFLFRVEQTFSVNVPHTGYGSWIVSEGIQAYSLIEWKDSFPKESIATAGSYTKARLALAEELVDDDNPVLMFYKLKPF
jgi:hypothetical protein